MADPQSIDSAGSFGIPKWMMRKGMRYEVDDFIVSPPSNEDGGFFHLRYGRSTSPRPSTYDRINQELGMTVEVKDGDPVLSDGLKPGGVGSPTATLAISSQGLTVQGSNQDSADVPAKTEPVKPLFVLPFKFGADSSVSSSGNKKDQLETPTEPESEEEKVEEAFKNITVQETNDQFTELQNGQRTEPYLDKPERDLGIMRKISRDNTLKLCLGEKIPDLSGTNAQAQPSATAISPPFVTPLTTPHSSPLQKRKISGVVVEQPNMSTTQNYFFTKPFQGTQQSQEVATQSFASESSIVSASAAAVPITKKVEEVANPIMNVDPSHLSQMTMGKKRQRPKASKLREMNFWAPTSM